MKNITPITRRQFIQRFSAGVTATIASFFILPSSLTYERIWRWVRARPLQDAVSGDAFVRFLLEQEPYYNELIIKDVCNGWIGQVETAPWDSYCLAVNGLYLKVNEQQA